MTRTRCAAILPARNGPQGKSRPLRVFPLAGQRPARQMGRPPLVGRKQDLAPLALLCDRSLEERHPQFLRRLKEVAARLG